MALDPLSRFCWRAGQCRFSSNCDKGLTWPDDNGPDSSWAVGAEFEAPDIPRKDGGSDDWGSYPRCEKNSDLLTMRVSPEAEHGYVVAEKLREGGGSVALACEPEHPIANATHSRGSSVAADSALPTARPQRFVL